MDIILASASPRRQELLKLIIPNFMTLPTNIDETVPEMIYPHDAPEFLARKKAAVFGKEYPKSLTIGCDTAVITDFGMLGKPKDEVDAVRMLKILSGNVHKVITGCCLYYMMQEYSFSIQTEVEFYPLTSKEINKYIKTGEYTDKAGAYAIQGYGSLLVKQIKGDYNNVVGLPVSALKREIEVFCPQALK